MGTKQPPIIITLVVYKEINPEGRVKIDAFKLKQLPTHINLINKVYF
jgi:hypothetical protein